MKSNPVVYKKIREDINDGDVLLFKGHGIISAIIKWKTKSEYSHAGIVAWWNDRLMVLEAVGKGVVARPISYDLEKYKHAIDYYRLKKEVSITDQKRTQMVIFAQEQLGKEYNHFQIFVFFIKLLFGMKLSKSDKTNNYNTYFCSQYVASIYARNGYDLAVEQSDSYTSPDNIRQSDKLEFVGTLGQ